MEEEVMEELGTSSYSYESVKTEIISHVELVILKYDKNYYWSKTILLTGWLDNRI